LDNGRYSIIQFLRAASNHGGLNLINVHTVDDAQEEEASAMDDMTAQTGGPVTQQNENLCEICMVNPRSQLALVPCGHSRFCADCIAQLQAVDSRFPICRNEQLI
jgi:hypothetical protein